MLLYKRLNNGKFQWPRSKDELKLLTPQAFRWLMEGLSVEQKKALSTTDKKIFFNQKTQKKLDKNFSIILTFSTESSKILSAILSIIPSQREILCDIYFVQISYSISILKHNKHKIRCEKFVYRN